MTEPDFNLTELDFAQVAAMCDQDIEEVIKAFYHALATGGNKECCFYAALRTMWEAGFSRGRTATEKSFPA